MQRTLRMAVLLPILALLPVLAEAQNTKKSKTPAPTEPAKIDEASVRSKVLAGPYIEGKLTAFSIDGEEKFFSVQYTYKLKRASPEKAKMAQAELQKLEGEYRQAFAKKDGQRIKEILAQAQAIRQNGGYEFDEHPIRFECKGDKDIVVRSMLIPVDENGKPKKLSAEEQKKLKGDPNLPGNMAALNDLDLEQSVRVFVDKTKYKPAPKISTPASKDKDAKDKDAKDKDAKDKDAKDDALIYPAKMIVIVPPPMDKAGGVGGNPFLK